MIGVALIALMAAAEGLFVRLEPLPCAPRDRYTTVTARVEPADAAASVELQFRSAESDWYGVAMKREDGVWRAVLPRPTSTLETLDYRVVATSSTLERTVPSEVLTARVTPPESCAVPGAASVASSIVVRVPPGAPLVPPVPAGFSPAGAITAQEVLVPQPRSRTKDWAAIAAGGAAVVGGAIAVTGAQDPAPLRRRDIPAFRFVETFPPAGSTLSASAGSLRVVAVMGHEPSAPVDFDWWFELYGPERTSSMCAVMLGHFNDAQRPVSLLLTDRFVVTGFCPANVDLVAAHFVIRVDDRVVLDTLIDLPLRLVP